MAILAPSRPRATRVAPFAPLAPCPVRDRELLEHLYATAVTAANPGPAVAQALDQEPHPATAPLWIVSVGKASVPMAQSAIATARRQRRRIVGGLVVPPEPASSPDPLIAVIVGDHPEPGHGSLAAATALGELAQRVGRDDEVWVLLSGGATSLIGAPEGEASQQDLQQLYSLLLASGLDITAMNTVRKRFTRWGGGKLARALGTARRIRQLVVSDVIGDDLAAIGSGPCVPDPSTAAEVRTLLGTAALLTRLPTPFRAALHAIEKRVMPETPKAGAPVFDRVNTTIVVSNRLALEAVARRAAELGLASVIIPQPLSGEAAEAGASVAAMLTSYRDIANAQHAARRCLIAGGETTVTLGPSPGLGGRCQELALAAAQVLAGRSGISLLAAGTDGRDGPTDAAGAVVDGSTWGQIRARGREPADDLARHDAYHALRAADALFKPGLTGTNVMDVVVGLA